MAKLIHVVVGWRSQLLTIVGLLTTRQLAFLRRDDLMVDGVGGGEEKEGNQEDEGERRERREQAGESEATVSFIPQSLK